MSSLTLTIDIKITVPGATADEIERGTAAAWKVFDDAEVNPWEAAAAAFKQETPVADPENPDDYPDMSERECLAANAWREAYDRAMAACCAGWASVPNGTDLELVYDKDAYSAWAKGQSRRADTDAALLRAAARAR